MRSSQSTSADSDSVVVVVAAAAQMYIVYAVRPPSEPRFPRTAAGPNQELEPKCINCFCSRSVVDFHWVARPHARPPARSLARKQAMVAVTAARMTSFTFRVAVAALDVVRIEK